MRLPIFLISLCSFSAYANELKLPDYSIFIEGQKKCDDYIWKELPWNKRGPDQFKIAYKVISIISDINLKEVYNKKRKANDKRQYRTFDLSYIAYTQIICGKKNLIENNGKGIKITDSPYITTAWKNERLLDWGTDTELYSQKDFMYFSLTPFGGDQQNLNRTGLEGPTCLVDLQDFIQDPLGKINLQRLCQDGNKNEIDFTKKEILRTADALKNSLNKVKENKK